MGWIELGRAGRGAHTVLVRKDAAGGGRRKAAGCSWSQRPVVPAPRGHCAPVHNSQESYN